VAIPVIDLFAGPGGLGEGFGALRDNSGAPTFDVRLSIEKDPVAHDTLELRAFYRSFNGEIPNEYYSYLRGAITKDDLFASRKFRANVQRAREEAWWCELSEANHKSISRRIRNTLRGANEWLLIGGPPCQAYSLAGRSRMRPKDPKKFEKDQRHFLYREYLRIIAEHRPPFDIALTY
jgi:DNA (cytosine-5)-methyltransferase 1